MIDLENVERPLVLDRTLSLVSGISDPFSKRSSLVSSDWVDQRFVPALQMAAHTPSICRLESSSCAAAPFWTQSGSLNGWTTVSTLSSLIPLYTNGYVVEERVWPSSASGLRTIFQAYNPALPAAGRWWLGLSGSTICVSNDPTGAVYLTSTLVSLQPKRWSSVSFHADGFDAHVYVDGLKIFDAVDLLVGAAPAGYKILFGATVPAEAAVVDPLGGAAHSCRLWEATSWLSSGSLYSRRSLNAFRGPLSGLTADEVVDFSTILVTGSSKVGPADVFVRERIYATSDVQDSTTGFTFASYLSPVDSWKRVGACDPRFAFPQVSAGDFIETCEKAIAVKLPSAVEQATIGLDVGNAEVSELAHMVLPGAPLGAGNIVGTTLAEHGVILFHPSMESVLLDGEVKLLFEGSKQETLVWLEHELPSSVGSTQYLEMREPSAWQDGSGVAAVSCALLSGVSPPLRVRIPVEVV